MIIKDRLIEGTDVRVTELGFGAASIGNLYRVTSDEDAAAAVHRAWEVGIRYFDTAPHYGLGLSEVRLGRALRKYPRDEYVISTKVGRLLVPNSSPTSYDSEGFAVPGDYIRRWDFTGAGVRQSLESSLKRLGLDRVDILYAHDPDEAFEGAGYLSAQSLLELKASGIVRAVGVGTNSAAEASRLLADTNIDLAMLAGRYTLLEQDAVDTALSTAAATNKSIVAVGVFNSGILASSRPAQGAHYNYGPAPQAVLDRALLIAEACESQGVSLPAAAIQFPLAHPNVVNVTVGMRTADQVDRNVALYEKTVPASLWDSLGDLGIIRKSGSRVQR